MDEFLKLFDNTILWTAVLCWVVAQALKVLFYVIKNRKFSFERVVGAGGMPSSHSATVCGLTAVVGRVCGLDSPLFAIAFTLACVVMYDATGIRRAAGEQAKVLNQLMEGQHTDPQKALKDFLGHTPLEVVAGAVLGLVIAFLMPVH